MAVALAAGAAGAFANSRKEIGDSLPGVAISISLVPPLSVVGIALSHGHFEDALGALLLFVTNFLAIILAGSVVFWTSGANAVKLTERQVEARKRAYIVAIVSSIIVALLLAATSFNAYRNYEQLTKTQSAVEEWIAESDYDTVTVVVREPDVGVTVAGSGELAPIEELAQDLNETFGSEVFVQVRKLIREKESYPDAATP